MEHQCNRITSSTEASKNEESDAASSEENESSTQEILTVAAPTLPTEENAAQGTSEAAEAAVNRPASYTVQPGDTLIEISEKILWFLTDGYAVKGSKWT
mgnify:CR=1 FL=1